MALVADETCEQGKAQMALVASRARQTTRKWKEPSLPYTYRVESSKSPPRRPRAARAHSAGHVVLLRTTEREALLRRLQVALEGKGARLVDDLDIALLAVFVAEVLVLCAFKISVALGDAEPRAP